MKVNLGWVLVSVGLAALFACSDKKAEETQQGEASAPKLMLECSLASPTLMDGPPLKLKVAKLWIASERTRILRAFEFPAGRVILNPYSLKKSEIAPAWITELSERKLATDWSSAFRFRFRDREKLILLDGAESSGLLVTLNSVQKGLGLADKGGELALLHCANIEAGTVTAHQQLAPDDAPVEPEPQIGCADGTTEQDFGNKMIGCTGKVGWLKRATLCGVGWKVCTAKEWVARRTNQPPKFNYWTDDALKYGGSSSGNCSVSLQAGNSCSADSPMRVCISETDPLGNACTWTRCGLDTTSNQFFGGCVQASSSTLCCQ